MREVHQGLALVVEELEPVADLVLESLVLFFVFVCPPLVVHRYLLEPPDLPYRLLHLYVSAEASFPDDSGISREGLHDAQ